VFLVQTIREGLYPALEHPQEQVSMTSAKPAAAPPAKTAVPLVVEAPTQEPQSAEGERDESAGESGVEASRMSSLALKRGSMEVQQGNKKMANRQAVQDVDRSVSVQTGPGLPQWSWEDVPLRWNGPVEHSQTLHLYYLSPGVNLLLAFFRLFFVAAL